jgi:hypothetical protein
MGLFSRKTTSLPASYTPETPPSIGPAELSDASSLMDRWDAVMGNSDATWDCLEMIARRGGFQGAHAALMEVMDGKPSSDVTNRPWRWWTEASRVAGATSDHELAGRIFLFTHLFTTQLVGKMLPAHQMDTGLGQPDPASYRAIAEQAVFSLGQLPPGHLIHDTATGKVDVASARSMAEQVVASS